MIDSSAMGLLGRHEGGSSCDGSFDRYSLIPGSFCESKIAEAGQSGTMLYNDVIRFKVSVNDPRGVGCGQSLTDLQRDFTTPWEGHSSIATDDCPQRFAIDELLDQAWIASYQLQAIDGEYMRVVQGSDRLRLTFQPIFGLDVTIVLWM
jgi:hypothetical protein